MKQVVKSLGMVNADPTFGAHPAVIDGAHHFARPQPCTMLYGPICHGRLSHHSGHDWAAGFANLLADVFGEAGKVRHCTMFCQAPGCAKGQRERPLTVSLPWCGGAGGAVGCGDGVVAQWDLRRDRGNLCAPALQHDCVHHHRHQHKYGRTMRSTRISGGATITIAAAACSSSTQQRPPPPPTLPARHMCAIVSVLSALLTRVRRWDHAVEVEPETGGGEGVAADLAALEEQVSALAAQLAVLQKALAAKL